MLCQLSYKDCNKNHNSVLATFVCKKPENKTAKAKLQMSFITQYNIKYLKEEIEKSSLSFRQLSETITAELEFADKLSDMEGKKSWPNLISKAADVVKTALSKKNESKLKQAVCQAEDIMAPIGKRAKQYTVHCIGHAHMDMNWMWSWPETVATANDTITTVLNLMEEFDDFCFSQSQASIYQIISRYNPELFELVKKRIAEGRWEVIASEWVEGDKNLASGESLIRHLLYTRRFMAEHFGFKPEDIAIAWNPDTFGHANTIAMLYTRGAVSRYYMCRGGQTELPPVFWWQSPDGSRLLVNFEQTWYNNKIGIHNTIGMLSFCKETRMKDWMLVFGVGDHGGGPTRNDICLCKEMNKWPIFPRFEFSTTSKYYKILEKQGDKLPVIDDELNFEFTGCYTSQSDIKRANRLAEYAMERAETSATFAYVFLGRDYPQSELRQGWIDTIFGHFHDILPGSGVKETSQYHNGLFQKTVASTGMIKTHSLRALANQIDTSFGGQRADLNKCTQMGAGAGIGTINGDISTASHAFTYRRPFIIFNTTAWPRSEVVELMVWDAENDDVHTKDFIAVKPDGTNIPVQRLNDGEHWGHNFVKLAIPVTVPSMGYSGIVVEPAGKKQILPMGYHFPGKNDFQGDVRNMLSFRENACSYTGKWAMENSSILVSFDRQTGGISGLLDKVSGTDIISEDNPAALLEYVLEQHNPMSSWIISKPRKVVCPLEMIYFKPGQSGPHQASYEGLYKINNSQIKVIYILKAGSCELEIVIEADWFERGDQEKGIPALRIKFPFAMTNLKGRYETPYGSILRKPDEDVEVPSQRWVSVSGKSGDKAAGCLLLNDCKYGYCLDKSTLRVNLLRSSYYPDPLPEHGKKEMRFALRPYGKKLRVSELVRAGAAFNHPLQIVSSTIHSGKFPPVSDHFISASPINVLVTAIKKAEDEDAVIVRLLETEGKETNANVSLDKMLINNFEKAVEVDFIEREIKNSTAKKTKKGFSVKVPANAVASVKLKLKLYL